MKLRKLKLNYTDGMRQAGTILTIRCDENGIPLESQWRRRLRDAKQDNCVEFVDDKKQSHSHDSKKDSKKKSDKSSKGAN